MFVLKLCWSLKKAVIISLCFHRYYISFYHVIVVYVSPDLISSRKSVSDWNVDSSCELKRWCDRYVCVCLRYPQKCVCPKLELASHVAVNHWTGLYSPVGSSYYLRADKQRSGNCIYEIWVHPQFTQLDYCNSISVIGRLSATEGPETWCESVSVQCQRPLVSKCNDIVGSYSERIFWWSRLLHPQTAAFQWMKLDVKCKTHYIMRYVTYLIKGERHVAVWTWNAWTSAFVIFWSANK